MKYMQQKAQRVDLAGIDRSIIYGRALSDHCLKRMILVDPYLEGLKIAIFRKEGVWGENSSPCLVDKRILANDLVRQFYNVSVSVVLSKKK